MPATNIVGLPGFNWYGSIAGTAGPPAVVEKAVADNYATALYVGDPVALVSDGTVARVAAGTGAATYGIVSAILQYRNSDGILVRSGAAGGRLLPANTRWTAFHERSLLEIIPVEGQMFVVDADDAVTVTTLAAAMGVEGSNADHGFSVATASTTMGLSACLLDISTVNTTDTLQWRIVKMLNQPGNDFTKTRARYVVRCNVAQTTGTGV